MAEVVGDWDDDPIPPRPGHEEVDDNGEEEIQNSHQSATQQPTPAEEQQQQQQEELSRTESNTTSSTCSRPREATELDELRRLSTESSSEASLSSGEYRVASRHSGASTAPTSGATAAAVNVEERRSNRRRKIQRIIPQPVRRFWARNVTLEVPHKGNRDYFALERTFLAYMRTAATFSIQGVLVAQLFRLQSLNSGESSINQPRINFQSVGIPLSVAYQTCAILVALMGAYRFWRQQNAIARGKVLAGGWEIYGIGIMTFLAGVTLFALAIAIIVETQ